MHGPMMQAVILVGGKGTRLRPLTLSAPADASDRGPAFLTHLLSRIKAAGIDDGCSAPRSRRTSSLRSTTATGSELGLRLRYVTEEAPLGTGGAIRNVLGELTADTILVFNGDVLGGTDVRQVLDTHRTSGADVTMHLVRVRSACVRLCAHRRHGPGHRLLEKTGPADRSDQRGCVRLPAIGHRGDSGRAAGVCGAGGLWTAQRGQTHPGSRRLFITGVGTPGTLARLRLTTVRGITVARAR